MERFDLVVVGDVNPDLVLAGPGLRAEFGQREVLAASADLLLGGSAAIVACAAARCGLHVALVALVGDDHHGRFCIDELCARGVDTSGVVVDPTVATGLTVILQDGLDRSIVTHLGAIAALNAHHVDVDLLRAGRHVHAASYFLLDGLRPDLPGLFGDVRRSGPTTSLDTNDDPRGGFDISAMYECCDILLPNDAEARRMTGSGSAASAAEILAGRVGIVAITTATGAVAQRGDEFVDVVAAPVVAADIVDPVGAGDNFDAGFLAAFLDGSGLEGCVKSGLSAAAESLRWRGGVQLSDRGRGVGGG